MSDLIDPAKLEADYFGIKTDKKVKFGTSGHRGTSSAGTFNQNQIVAIAQAICEFRQANHTTGPIFVGKDTHALSDAAQRTAVEVLASNGVETYIQQSNGYTPTPAISHAILKYNATHRDAPGDGVVITPSHNPPEDGGFKYNPPDGGPADTAVTDWIQNRANELLQSDVPQVTSRTSIHEQDYVTAYVEDLQSVIDMDAIKASGISIGVDPMGGASLNYWEPIAQRYGLKLTVVNKDADPRFAFMPPDRDGRIRMDCSSPHAMANLLKIKDDYDIAWGNDPDADRHGIVTRSVGLMNPNHFLLVAIDYLLAHRPQWPPNAVVGKTLVSSSSIDRLVEKRGRTLWEVPVGFKWFAPGLFNGSCCFGGEESAGASFLRRDGTVWSTDKDGLILGLLAAEIRAVTGKDPGEHYRRLAAELGETWYARVDIEMTDEQRAGFEKLKPDTIAATLAGDPVLRVIDKAPGNNKEMGGVKAMLESGWFAARGSGTENKYKIYAESFRSQAHLDAIVAEARDMVTKIITPAAATASDIHCSSVSDPPNGLSAS